LELAYSRDRQIHQAMADRRLIAIDYNGRRRIVEPHDFGLLKDADRLLVYQLQVEGRAAGRSETGWRLLDFDKITSLVILESHFKGSRRHDHHEHYTWDAIYARIE
jgi:hypothetical protein